MISRSLNFLNIHLGRQTNRTKHVIHRHCSSATDSPSYDLRYYKSPYSEEEEEFLMSVLNSSSVSELQAHSVPKSVAAKICSKRAKKGKMNTFNELPLVTEIGLKKIELMCAKILKHQTDSKDEIAAKSRIARTVIPSVKPKLTRDFVERNDNFISVVLRGRTLAWCEMTLTNSVHQETKSSDEDDKGALKNITSVKYLFNNFGYFNLSSSFDHENIAKEMFSNLEQIPVSNIYLLPFKETNKSEVIHSALHSQRLGFTLSALGCRCQPHDISSENDNTANNIYFIRENSAIKRLYKMNPRFQFQPIISSLYQQTLPHLHTPKNVLTKYKEIAGGYHSQVIDRAVMLACYIGCME